MDKETFELYYGEKEADRAYVVSLPGDNFTMPNVCACCLDKSAPVTVQKTVRRVNRFTKRPYYISAAKFPLCPACMLHQNELSFKTGLSSAVSTVLAFAVTLIFNASPHSFTFGTVTLVAAYFLLLYLIKVPALSHEHTARSLPVALHYSVKPVEENENGTVTASARYAVAGTEVTLTSEPNSGYRFHEWNITPEVTVTDNKFVMPEEAVTVSAVFARRSTGGGSSASTTYTVKFDTDGGSEIDSIKVTKNKTLDEPTEPTKDGYKFGGWYTDTELTKAYDFDTKVTADFTLYAKWTKIEVEPDDNNEPTTPDWVNPFTDVAESDWFYGNVEYANKNGLFSGITDTAFAPNDNITRGMFVTVLYRAEGEPEMQNKSIPFSDVKADMYYANAVNWAQQNGIVNGVTETEFAPDDNITREQMAAIMFRYAQHKGKDTTQGGMAIREFSDYEAISDYALNAMTWAVNTKLITGKGENTLAPQDNATRAETAAILQRYIEANK